MNGHAHRLRTLVPVAALLASALIAAQTSPRDSVVEPRSGTPFPTSIVPPGGTVPHRLVGTGLRDRTVFRIKIYAFALFVDSAAARSALAAFAGAPASALERDERFYRRLLDLEFAMTLRLVMLRTVDGADVSRAFDEALKTRLARAERETTGAAGLAALATFKRLFDVPEVRSGTEIVFSCTPQGRLASSVAGARPAVIDSRPLCRALFDVYLGVNPISPSGRKSAIAGFPPLLAPVVATR